MTTGGTGVVRRSSSVSQTGQDGQDGLLERSQFLCCHRGATFRPCPGSRESARPPYREQGGLGLWRGGGPPMERRTDRERSLLPATHEVSGIITQSGQAPPRSVQSEPVPHCVALEPSIAVSIARPPLRHSADRLPRSMVVPLRYTTKVRSTGKMYSPSEPRSKPEYSDTCFISKCE